MTRKTKYAKTLAETYCAEPTERLLAWRKSANQDSRDAQAQADHSRAWDDEVSAALWEREADRHMCRAIELGNEIRRRRGERV